MKTDNGKEFWIEDRMKMTNDSRDQSMSEEIG